MGIGTSLGAYFDDAFHHQAGINTDPSIDNNTIDPDLDSGAGVKPKPKLDIMKVSDTPDYDYDAWRKANPDAVIEPGQHYPDTYKLPNHITFSDESIYHNDDNQGGHWSTDALGKDTFTPGPANLKNYNLDQMQDYFKRVEPDARLITPGSAEDLANKARDRVNQKSDLPATKATSDADVGNVFPQTAQEFLQTGKIRYTDEEKAHAEELGLGFMGAGINARGLLRDSPGSIASDQPIKGPLAPRGSAEELEAALGPSPAEQVIRSLRRQTPVEGENMEAVMRRVHDTATPVNESFDELMARLDREDALVQEAREAGAKNFKDYGKVQVADRGYGSFLFKAEDSKVYPLRVSERNNGKTLYVDWVGDESEKAINTFSKGTIKGLFKALADKYPNAEEIAGYRVTGARSGPVGSGAMTARMKIPGRGKKEPARKSIDDLSREWDEAIE